MVRSWAYESFLAPTCASSYVGLHAKHAFRSTRLHDVRIHVTWQQNLSGKPPRTKQNVHYFWRCLIFVTVFTTGWSGYSFRSSKTHWSGYSSRSTQTWWSGYSSKSSQACQTYFVFTFLSNLHTQLHSFPRSSQVAAVCIHLYFLQYRACFNIIF